MATSDAHLYRFPAIRGVQAGREFYSAMCPLRLIPKLFLFDEEEIPAELRSQRILNKARVPDIARYVIENPKQYVFSSLTASVDVTDGEVTFDPAKPPNGQVGQLSIPMSSRFLLNDGQHRRAAIEEVLKVLPDVGHESISVVFFIDTGLHRSQQMFADLNKHAIRPTQSLGVLYDIRDPLSALARDLVGLVEIFKGMVERERTSIPNRSTKLFTLSSIYQATRDLLRKKKRTAVTKEDRAFAVEFWNEVGRNMPDWQRALRREVSSAELRRDTIHAHGIALHAIGIAGAVLLEQHPRDWKTKLRALSGINWSRENADLWEGRALTGGRVSKAAQNLTLTSIALKELLGVRLNEEEKALGKRAKLKELVPVG